MITVASFACSRREPTPPPPPAPSLQVDRQILVTPVRLARERRTRGRMQARCEHREAALRQRVPHAMKAPRPIAERRLDDDQGAAIVDVPIEHPPQDLDVRERAGLLGQRHSDFGQRVAHDHEVEATETARVVDRSSDPADLQVERPLADDLAPEPQSLAVLVQPGGVDSMGASGRAERSHDPPGHGAQTRADVEDAPCLAVPRVDGARRYELANRRRSLGNVANERERQPRGAGFAQRGARPRRVVVRPRQGGDALRQPLDVPAGGPAASPGDTVERFAPVVLQRAYETVADHGHPRRKKGRTKARPGGRDVLPPTILPTCRRARLGRAWPPGHRRARLGRAWPRPLRHAWRRGRSRAP